MQHFQKVIPNGLGVAVPGTIVMAAGSYKAVTYAVTEDTSCSIGGAACKGTSTGKVKGSGTGEFLGFIVNDQYYTGQTLGQALPAGVSVTILVNGIMAIAVPSGQTAVFGQDVYIIDATGAVVFSSTVVADATKTEFTVFQNAPDGGVAFIKR